MNLNEALLLLIQITKSTSLEIGNSLMSIQERIK
jgi:hypothetical protein